MFKTFITLRPLQKLGILRLPGLIGSSGVIIRLLIDDLQIKFYSWRFNRAYLPFRDSLIRFFNRLSRLGLHIVETECFFNYSLAFVLWLPFSQFLLLLFNILLDSLFILSFLLLYYSPLLLLSRPFLGNLPLQVGSLLSLLSRFLLYLSVWI